MGDARSTKTLNNNLHIVDKVTQVPLVSDSLNFFTNLYCNAKNGNFLIKRCCEIGESSISTSIAVADVVATRTGIKERLEPAVQYVDNSACNFFDTFEERVPIIKQKPNEMVGYFKEQCCEKCNHVKQFGEHKCSQAFNNVKQSRYAVAVNNNVVYGMERADHMIDQYLPANQDEIDGMRRNGFDTTANTPANEPYQKTVIMARRVGGKLRRRVPNKFVEKRNSLQTTLDNSRIYQYGNSFVSFVYKTTLEQTQLWYTAYKNGKIQETLKTNCAYLLQQMNDYIVKLVPMSFKQRAEDISNSGVAYYERVVDPVPQQAQTDNFGNIPLDDLNIPQNGTQQESSSGEGVNDSDHQQNNNNNNHQNHHNNNSAIRKRHHNAKNGNNSSNKNQRHSSNGSANKHSKN